jgi:hypothetical protein
MITDFIGKVQKRVRRTLTRGLYYSQFGGLWTDRVDALELLEKGRKASQFSDKEAEQLTFWIRNGYVIIPRAIEDSLCNEYLAELDHIWAKDDERFKVFHAGKYIPMKANLRYESKLLDAYVYSNTARQLLLHHSITRFLNLAFGKRSPLLMQSLGFEKGLEGGLHQDTGYVVVHPPLELAACWIALEDIQPGSGELQYYEGSHRIKDFIFSNQFKYYNPVRDGQEQGAKWLSYVEEESKRLGLQLKTFLPKKGDVLIWSADLVHGGSPVQNKEVTRRSLVGHFCPTDATPHYYNDLPEHRTQKEFQSGAYSSLFYKI